MFLTPTAPDDIEVLIGNMNVSKGVGPNSFLTKILTDYKSEFPKPLSDMINTSFATGIFPNALKVANVIPIHKKHARLGCNSYQPISLLSNISRIYEKKMHIRLTSLKISFIQVFTLVFEINIPQAMPLLVSLK